MPCSLKLLTPNFTSSSSFLLHHHHHNKPYYPINTNFLPLTESPSSSDVKSPPPSILRLNFSSGAWWRMTTSCAAAPSRFTSPAIRASKSHLFSADSLNRGRKEDRRDSDSAVRMRATVNGGKVDSVVPPPQKFLTLPTILTIGRVAAVPLLVTTFYAESWWGPNITTGIFVAAAITDWLDGYLARRMNLRTQFGAFLDPVADKLMVAATLILLCTRPFDAGVFGQAPWLLTVPAIAIIGREITMSAVREWAASQDKKLLEAVAVNNLGKWKTATQMISLTILLASRDSSFIATGPLVSSGVMLLYASAWLALWSLVVYMKKIWKVLLR